MIKLNLNDTIQECIKQTKSDCFGYVDIGQTRWIISLGFLPFGELVFYQADKSNQSMFAINQRYKLFNTLGKTIEKLDISKAYYENRNLNNIM